MRKPLLILSLSVGVLAGLSYWTLNSTWLSVRLARRALHGMLPEARLTELAIGQQHFHWPGGFAWNNVRLGIKYKGRDYNVVVPRLMLSGAQGVFRDKADLKISAAGADIFFPPGEAKDAKIELTVSLVSRKVVRAEGLVTLAKLAWDKLEARQVRFRVLRNIREFEFDNIQASAYGGTITGKARLVPAGLVYAADLALEGIDTSQLADWLSTQVVGRATGRIRISGKAETLSTLESDFSMLTGARVSASLLSVVVQVIPQLPDRKRLDALIKQGGQFPVEILKFTVRSQSPQHWGGELTLRSREVNLAINISHDINPDGTLLYLLNIGNLIFNSGRF